MALTDKLTAIADAIRGKTGGTEELTLDQMATEIAGISGGSGDDYFTKMLTGTTFDFESDLEEIADYALFYNYWATSVSIPNATKVGNSAFAQMNKCTHISAPKLTAVPDRFAWGTKITSVDLPPVKKIGNQAFMGTQLKSFPNLSLVEYILDSVFQGISTITDKSLILPSIINIGYSAFQEITSLELVDLGENLSPKLANSPHLRRTLFSGCIGLKTLILRKTSLVLLENVNAFHNTPFASGGTGGTVYVPQALIPEYQQATNWSTLYAAGTCNFVAIEGSEYE